MKLSYHNVNFAVCRMIRIRENVPLFSQTDERYANRITSVRRIEKRKRSL